MVVMLARFIENQILDELKPGKVVGIFGARRVGKTVLMQRLRERTQGGTVLMIQGEDLTAAEIVSSQRVSEHKKLVAGYSHLFIDEAQKIPRIGENLKLMVDAIPELSILVSGSSAFDLRTKIGEPLVGRSRFFHLYPLAQLELRGERDYLRAKESLEDLLIFGSYPQIITAASSDEKKDILKSIKDGYLLRDILELDNIKDSLFVLNVLRLIAFQIGNDVSYAELGRTVGANNRTVMRYLELLEKSYVLFSVPGFSRNLRKEYTKTPRYYFCDNGIRNAVISNFNPLHSRDDVGKLWENFCVAEMVKRGEYKKIYANRYYWRTYDQKEIDYLEERDGKLFGYEMKWTGAARVPRSFIAAYPDSEFQVINRDNYLDILGG